MNTIRRVEEARFNTKAKDGTQVVVIQWVKIITARPISGPSTDMTGTRDWTLLNGAPVNYIDDNTFEVVETEEVLRRV